MKLPAVLNFIDGFFTAIKQKWRIKSGFDRENYERLLGTILEVMPAEEKAILVNGAEKER